MAGVPPKRRNERLQINGYGADQYYGQIEKGGIGERT